MIKKFKKDNINEVMQIWLETNIKAHNFIPEDYWLENFEYTKKAILQAEVYIYQKEDKIVGFSGLSDNYIGGIFVLPKYQSQGIGKEILEYLKDIKTELSLSVYKKNEKAIKFYRREKFVTQLESVEDSTKEEELFMVWKK